MSLSDSQRICRDGGLVGIDEKVAALKRPASYPCRTVSVEPVETHMAWVFLTDRHAYKLKKPVRYDYLDFSTIEARRLDCHRELQLNRRLAADVYLNVVPLSLDSQGTVHVEEHGTVIDWLVKMQRLPRERMLERAIGERSLDEDDVRGVAERLGQFYRRSPPVEMTAIEYRHRLIADISKNLRDLIAPPIGLPRETVEPVAEAMD